MRRFYASALCLALGALCWTLCLCAWSAHGLRFPERVSVRGGMDFSQLKELRRLMDGEGAVTGWGQSLSVAAEVRAFNESTFIDVIWTDGDAARVWSAPMIAGQMPAQGDDIGCALDGKTALKLFGSLNILGLEVRVNGQDMVVRGVFELPEGIEALGVDPGRGLAFCPASLSEDARMDALEFSLGPADGKTAVERAAQFMQDAGMGGGAPDGHEDVSSLMRFLSGLPGDVLALLAAIELALILLHLSRFNAKALRQLRADVFATRGAYARVLTGWLAQALACTALAYAAMRLAAHGGKIPASYLPTRWSDFSFWSRLVEEIAQNAAAARFTVALRPDMIADRLIGLAAVLGVCAIALFLIARQTLRTCKEIGAVRAVAAGLIVCAAPVLALEIGAALGWYAAGLPMALRVLPAAAFALWIVPGNFRLTIQFRNHHPRLERGNARSKKRAAHM